MASYLLSPSGRIGRSRFWLAVLIYLLAAALLALAMVVLWQIIPGTQGDDGEFQVTGAAALPYLLLVFAYFAFAVWSGICIGIKRFHDRDKSGWWVLIQLVPFVGAIWYFVEAGCLAGTYGPNRFGPDPLGGARF